MEPSTNTPGQVNTVTQTTAALSSNSPGETTDGNAGGGTPEPLLFLASYLATSGEPADLGMLADYRIVRVLGHGGMGVVLHAVDTVLNRTVAIKLMRPDVAASPAAKERFLREARAMAALDHPRVVAIHHVGQWRDMPFLVMPLMKGCSLGNRLEQGPPLTSAEIVRFGREIAEGLAAAHARGVVHRDIKPDNIWLEETAEGAHVRLLDFGLARDDAAEAMTRAGTVFGTPSYMAPEQAQGERVDGRADLFSLGAVLFEMATGQKAFAGTTITAVMFALANHQPPAAHTLNPAIPAGLSRLIESLLAKQRDGRPPTAAAVAATLKGMNNNPSTTTTELHPAPPRKEARRSRRIFGIAGVAFVLFAAVASAVYFRPSEKSVVFVGKDEGPVPVVVPVAPLRVEALDVKHFAETEKGNVPRGVLGRDSFTPRLGDRVQVVAKLTRPAYAYLIALRPDGEVELCFPDTEDEVPPLTDTPRYPAADSNKAYGLREGTGLWAFAVVASETPLPPYKQWRSANRPKWKREEAPGGAVWWYDGSALETFAAVSSPTRGKDEDLSGPAASVRGVGKWLERTAGAKVGVVGFGVEPRN